MSISEGSKLRRGRTVDLSHKGHWIYTWIFVSSFHGWKSRNILKHKVSKAKRIVWVIADLASGKVVYY
jgi:hypothetical protein